MVTMAARVITTNVEVPLKAAYAFANQPVNFPAWASGMSSSLRATVDGWRAETPAGPATIEFTAENDHGVLDHWVHFEDGREIHIPLRMVANGSGTLVELVLFRQAGMSEADFEDDGKHVERDLAALKDLLEQTIVVDAARASDA